MIHDVAIIGAGPAGLCLARALSGQGLSIVLLERQAETALADPAFDGREIALTHASQALLEQLDLWQRLPAEEVAVLRDAQVLNGPSLFALKIEAGQAGAERLQGEDWLRFLDGTTGARFSHGPGRLLLEGGFRRRLDDGEFAAVSALARARFLELMEGRR